MTLFTCWYNILVVLFNIEKNIFPSIFLSTIQLISHIFHEQFNVMFSYVRFYAIKLEISLSSSSVHELHRFIHLFLIYIVCIPSLFHKMLSKVLKLLIPSSVCANSFILLHFIQQIKIPFSTLKMNRKLNLYQHHVLISLLDHSNRYFKTISFVVLTIVSEFMFSLFIFC